MPNKKSLKTFDLRLLTYLVAKAGIKPNNLICELLSMSSQILC